MFSLTTTVRGDADKVRLFTQALWSLLQHSDFHVYLAGPEAGRAVTLRHPDPEKLRFALFSIQTLAGVCELRATSLAGTC